MKRNGAGSRGCRWGVAKSSEWRGQMCNLYVPVAALPVALAVSRLLSLSSHTNLNDPVVEGEEGPRCNHIAIT